MSEVQSPHQEAKQHFFGQLKKILGEKLYRTLGYAILVIFLVVGWLTCNLPGSTTLKTYWHDSTNPLPMGDSLKLNVAIAEFEGDEDNWLQRKMVADLRNLPVTADTARRISGFETLKVPRKITLSSGSETERRFLGNTKARTLMGECKADIIFWGERLDNNLLSLNWVTNGASGRRGENDLIDEQGRLPKLFIEDLADILGIVILTQFDRVNKEGQYSTPELEKYASRLRSLIVGSSRYTRDELASLRHVLVIALIRISEETGRPGELSEAIQLCEDVLGGYGPAHLPHEWASANNTKGNALLLLGTREFSKTVLEGSIFSYREALKVYSLAITPEDWAAVQNNLGTALHALGENIGSSASLEEAVGAFRNALKVFTRERNPIRWGGVQSNLGTALQSLGERESSSVHLQEAVLSYENALQECRIEVVPLNWAMIHNNLGNTLTTLGEREYGNEYFNEAILNFRAALSVYTRKETPVDWAMTENNLGRALQRLGERKGERELLTQAVQSYRNALKERDREKSPLDWAMSQNNLGTALIAIAERETDTSGLVEAISAFKCALLEYSRVHTPVDWAMTQSNLGNALRLLGERSRNSRLFVEAIEAYRSALLEISRGKQALEWAMIQSNLAIALSTLGENDRSSDLLIEAIRSYRAALEVYSQEDLPLQWAMIQYNLGKTLFADWQLSNNMLQLSESISSSLRGWDILFRSGHAHCEFAKNRVVQTLSVIRERDLHIAIESLDVESNKLLGQFERAYSAE